MQKHDECSGESTEVSRYPAPHCVGENSSTLRIQQEEYEDLKQFTSTSGESQALYGEDFDRVPQPTRSHTALMNNLTLSFLGITRTCTSTSLRDNSLAKNTLTTTPQADGQFSNPFAQTFRFLEKLICHHNTLLRFTKRLLCCYG